MKKAITAIAICFILAASFGSFSSSQGLSQKTAHTHSTENAISRAVQNHPERYALIINSANDFYEQDAPEPEIKNGDFEEPEEVEEFARGTRQVSKPKYWNFNTTDLGG